MRVTRTNKTQDRIRYAKGFGPVGFASVLGKRSSKAIRAPLVEALKSGYIDSELRYPRAHEYVKRVKLDPSVDVRGVTVVSAGFNKQCLRFRARGCLRASVNIPEGTIFHTGKTMQNLAVVKGFKGVVEKGNDLVLDAYCMDLRFGCPHGDAKATNLKVKPKMSSFSDQYAFWTWMAPCSDVRIIITRNKKTVTEEAPPKVPGVRRSCGELFRLGITNDRAPDPDSSDSDSDSDSSDDGSSGKRRRRKRRKKRYKFKGVHARREYGWGKKSQYVCPRDGRCSPLKSEKNISEPVSTQALVAARHPRRLPTSKMSDSD